MDELDKYLDELRKTKPDVTMPDFSTEDGRTEAKILFLLQDPGKSGAANSGVVDRSNNDATARNFCKANDDAKLNRETTVVWNAIPWAIPDDSSFAKELKRVRSEKWLDRLLDALPRLEVVVLLGNNAHLLNRDLYLIRRDLHILHGPHPSQRGVNKAEYRAWLDAAVRKTRDMAIKG